MAPRLVLHPPVWWFAELDAASGGRTRWWWLEGEEWPCCGCCILRRERNGRQALHPRGDEWRRVWLHPSDGRRMALLVVASSVQWGPQMLGWKHVELTGEVRLAVEADVVVRCVG